MKSTLLVILSIFFIVICIVSGMLIDIQSQKREIEAENREYTKYMDKEILGTELATLINKAVAQNKKNGIPKNEKGYYIENEENSIKIDLKMTTIDKTYPMEEIYNNETAKFVENFNTINFKCINIEYHKKTNRVAKLIFEELQ